MKIFLFATTMSLLFHFSTSAFADSTAESNAEYDFEKVKVEGVTCGDGSPYSYYLRRGDPQKVLLNFQGGGACWDRMTCDASTPFTRLKDEFSSASGDYFSTRELKNHPFVDYTYIFLPYCTGDIFSGSHHADYKGLKVRHTGRVNVETALAQLAITGGDPLSQASKVVVYGGSAGAIGVMLNMDVVLRYVRPDADRTMILDSPGLHFSSSIWSRFSGPYMNGIKEAFSRNGMEFDQSTGLVSKQSRRFCDSYSDWKIGFIQSTRDLIMSVTFGNLTPARHKQAVLGSEGLPHLVKDETDACSSWVPDHTRHIWATDGTGWWAKTFDGKVLKDFIDEKLNGKLGDRFLNHQ